MFARLSAETFLRSRYLASFVHHGVGVSAWSLEGDCDRRERF